MHSLAPHQTADAALVTNDRGIWALTISRMGLDATDQWVARRGDAVE